MKTTTESAIVAVAYSFEPKVPNAFEPYQLSVVVDLESQISLSFTLDNRKRLVFRPSEQI